MRRGIGLLLGCGLTVACAATTTPGQGAEDAVAVRSAPLAGCDVFPDDNWWHADVSSLPVHDRSADWLSHMSTDVDLHPDFGGRRYGIPITVVGRDHRKVRVRFRYADESDRVRYPLGRDTRIEGGGDRHAIVVDRGRCRLYETWATRKRDGRWYAGSGAVFDLDSNALRPDGWTSADAAGLPILPGLLRWSEVKNDTIDHAIRFTTDVTAEHYLWPARHEAGTKSLAWPPMGARFRLDPDYDASDLGAAARRVVEALQTYGLVLADNGSPWFFQGERNRSWPGALLDDLKTIPASAFEAVDTSCLKVDPDEATADPDGCA
ncbi:hypothetical protein HNR19_002856 [Nocardioides thalensis]|uniref:Uncharacterized protein n=1 Tax=Nocardioides thalensis TaxID=1914755 RepID=A0A853C6Q7_9ACTN|nr:hypothetical protein [Nocardioides thalensis]NYJ02158.1 hypothetical protein [Nocardioides thalensis]